VTVAELRSSLGETLEPLETSRCAVVVVDLQNDFCAPDGALGRTGMAIEPLHAVIDHVNQLTRTLRVLGAKVVFLRSVYTDANGRFRAPAMAAQAHRRWNGRGLMVPFLREGHRGSELHPEVETHTGDTIVRKHSYDGFFRSRLGPVLRAASARHVIVAGITTDICVLFTSQEAFQRGYDVLIAQDCVAAYDAARHRAALHVLSHAIARVAPCHEILAAAQATAPVRSRPHLQSRRRP
jgi:ureidoacrylate peracid hydrolase